MATLTDPDKQPKYQIPNNLLRTPSLQSPTTPFEYLLWKFDERRGQITKKAAERITQYKETEKPILPITEPAFACPTTSSLQKAQTPDTSDSENEETTIEEQLLKQRKQQKLLRRGIQQLLNRLATLE